MTSKIEMFARRESDGYIMFADDFEIGRIEPIGTDVYKTASLYDPRLQWFIGEAFNWTQDRTLAEPTGWQFSFDHYCAVFRLAYEHYIATMIANEVA